MNYSHFRFFGFGIVFATIIFTAIYYFHDKEQVIQAPPISENDVNNYLAENNLRAITNQEYDQLKLAQSKVAELEKQIQQPKKEIPRKTESPKVVTYNLEIKQGMYSTDISSVLEKAKIINSADDFSRFLIDHDYHTHIQIGEYQVTNKMSYQEIGVIITKGKNR